MVNWQLDFGVWSLVEHAKLELEAFQSSADIWCLRHVSGQAHPRATEKLRASQGVII